MVLFYCGHFDRNEILFWVIMKTNLKEISAMVIFHKNKDSRSKGQNKNEFDFISPVMKTNVNRFLFHGKTKLHFG